LCTGSLTIPQYEVIHRYETIPLRNVSKLFAILLGSDGISWEVLSCVRLTEEHTTSSSRIFVKILFQELSETMGLKKLNARLMDPDFEQWFSGLFPSNHPKVMRFAINYWTSIGLGGLT
jgi:pre-mRNA-splicing factor CWC22